MRNSVNGVGTLGIVRDTKPQLLPYNVWSDGRNVRFTKNRCYGMGGVVAGLATAKTGLLNVGIVNSPTQDYTIYTTGTKVYSWDGSTEHDITRTVGGDYSEDADNLFNIQSFNGFGVLNNNGVDTPQLWNPTAGGSTDLVALTNWNANWLTKRLRPFKAFLVAMNMTESSTLYPHKLRWSHPAEAGAVPSSWDETDATKDAGEFNFPDTEYGELVDGLELGNRFFIYKEGSIWAMSFVSGAAIFDLDPLVRSIGLQVPRSLVEIPNYKGSQPVHFFAGDESFYIMDGIRPIPVFEEVFEKEILALRDPTHYKTRSFTAVNPRHEEVWFCIPESGAEYATLAFCLNYVNGTYSIRELSGATKIISGFGVQFSQSTAVAELPYSDETLFSDDTGFADVENLPGVSVILEASPNNEMFYYLETGALDYDETPFVRYVERVGMATVQADPRRPESLREDYNVRKQVDRFTPKIVTGSAQVYVGRQETEMDPVAYLDPVVVDSSVHSQYLSTPLSGRFIAFKWESLGEDDFAIAGFDYNVEILGEW